MAPGGSPLRIHLAPHMATAEKHLKVPGMLREGEAQLRTAGKSGIRSTTPGAAPPSFAKDRHSCKKPSVMRSFNSLAGLVLIPSLTKNLRGVDP